MELIDQCQRCGLVLREGPCPKCPRSRFNKRTKLILGLTGGLLCMAGIGRAVNENQPGVYTGAQLAAAAKEKNCSYGVIRRINPVSGAETLECRSLPIQPSAESEPGVSAAWTVKATTLAAVSEEAYELAAEVLGDRAAMAKLRARGALVPIQAGMKVDLVDSSFGGTCVIRPEGELQKLWTPCSGLRKPE